MLRILAALAGWILTAAAAVAAGLLAVSILGTTITDSRVQPLSHHDVAQALAHTPHQPPTTPTPSTSRTPPPSTPPRTSTGTEQVTRALGTPGGSIIARCTGTTAYLVSWSPRQGFDTDDQIRGPAPTTYLKFDGDDLDVYTTISCRNGTPVAHAATEPDD